jgi:hypothetical protein
MTIVIASEMEVWENALVMENKTPNTMEAFEAVMQEYRELSPNFKQWVRKSAMVDMQESGMYDEIGSSDVNCHIFSLYRQLGSFDAIIRNAVDLMR